MSNDTLYIEAIGIAYFKTNIVIEIAILHQGLLWLVGLVYFNYYSQIADKLYTVKGARCRSYVLGAVQGASKASLKPFLFGV